MTQGPDHNSYYHERFLRGRPELCAKMKRPGKTKADREDGVEPDFYKMSIVNPLPENPFPESQPRATAHHGSRQQDSQPHLLERKMQKQQQQQQQQQQHHHHQQQQQQQQQQHLQLNDMVSSTAANNPGPSSPALQALVLQTQHTTAVEGAESNSKDTGARSIGDGNTLKNGESDGEQFKKSYAKSGDEDKKKAEIVRQLKEVMGSADGDGEDQRSASSTPIQSNPFLGGNPNQRDASVGPGASSASTSGLLGALSQTNPVIEQFLRLQMMQTAGAGSNAPAPRPGDGQQGLQQTTNQTALMQLMQMQQAQAQIQVRAAQQPQQQPVEERSQEGKRDLSRTPEVPLAATVNPDEQGDVVSV